MYFCIVCAFQISIPVARMDNVPNESGTGAEAPLRLGIGDGEA